MRFGRAWAVSDALSVVALIGGVAGAFVLFPSLVLLAYEPWTHHPLGEEDVSFHAAAARFAWLSGAVFGTSFVLHMYGRWLRRSTERRVCLAAAKEGIVRVAAIAASLDVADDEAERVLRRVARRDAHLFTVDEHEDRLVVRLQRNA